MATKPQTNYTPGSSKDDLLTPAYGLEPLLPYLPKGARLWESAVGPGLLRAGLEHFGYAVTATGYLNSVQGQPEWLSEDQNRFTLTPPEYDIEVTNPPFSLKFDWMNQALQDGKPWALLVQDDTPATGAFLEMVQGLSPQPGFIWFAPRIAFKTPNKKLIPGEGWSWIEDDPKSKKFGKMVRSSAQFGTLWITWNLGFEGNVFLKPYTHWNRPYRTAWENWHLGVGDPPER